MVEFDEKEGLLIGCVIVFVVFGFGVLLVIIFGIYKLQQLCVVGDGQLIVVQEGDYKVKFDDFGGLKVKGEGDSVIVISVGKGVGNGVIDLNGVFEKLVDGKCVKIKVVSDVVGYNVVV